MVAITDNDKYFYMQILNYEFPESTDKGYDGNWLMVNVRVNNGRYQWTKSDPAILTWEAKLLYKWFKNLSENKKNKYNDISFTEPVIRFKLLDDDFYRIYLRIKFNAEFVPEGFDRGDPAAPNPCFADFTINKKEFGRITEELKAEIDKFPKRCK